MPETGTSGSMSGDGKRSDGQRPQVTAPILDSTDSDKIPHLAETTRWANRVVSHRGKTASLFALGPTAKDVTGPRC